MKRIFCYLKGSAELWLIFGGKEKELTGYTDADGSMAEDRHAILGYAFILHGGAVSWSAKQQKIVLLSTTESKYVAVTHAAKEALWLRSLLSQIFVITPKPTTLFSDNQSAIAGVPRARRRTVYRCRLSVNVGFWGRPWNRLPS